ncbi:hypothetical protein [Cryobacterium roopkundense]|uniref:Uncharacterized protein n=1 Tax=Cryobacterium roopkundense TaxID=1001240 RepID=A0A7W9E2V8_9MICO|nr:hypothetical protein [Cryobacterium roopkundense]MBB5640538.1 hypothetical protein [Cryobacterium roopkundense]
MQQAISERIGSFTSPMLLPAGANSTLIVATALASLERALTLRQHWLIDPDSTWSDDE